MMKQGAIPRFISSSRSIARILWSRRRDTQANKTEGSPMKLLQVSVIGLS